MIVKLQNGDKIKVESDEKREARRKYKEYSLLSIGLKLKRNLNIASNFLKAGPNITNFGSAVSALFGGFSPENPDVTKGDPPAVGIKNFENLVRTARVAREFEKAIASATKNGRLEVTSNYFNSPNNWYRITETPEKFGIMEQGKNVTTADATLTVGTVNGWRSSMLKAPVTKGTGKNEGYFTKKPTKIDINIRRKNGLAHGNTSQAAKGHLWEGTTSLSRMFPMGIIEGESPLTVPYGLNRSNFINTQWENIPMGGRIGFHTGEMPMSNLGWFLRTKNGTYTYEPIIPEKRILVLPTSKITKSKPYIRWSQKGYLNEAYNIEGGPGQKFIVVKDVDNPLPGVLNTKGNGEYSLHFHSTRDNPNKEKMFQALAESIPEGGKVSTWGTISKGGYHGINRFGELFGWPKVGERPAINGPVNIFLKPNAKQLGMQRAPNPFEELLNPWNKIRTSVEEKVNPAPMDYEYLMLSSEGRSLLYNSFIHGKDIPIIGKQNITNGLSDIAKTNLLENTVERNIREFEKENLYIGDYYSKILKALENVKVGRYPKSYYTEARSPFEGFYVPDKNFISLQENNISGEIHEGRHLIDHISSLTPRLENILSKAFSDDFINLPKWKLAPEALKKYKHMDRERVTTNRDARHALLRELNVPLYSFNFNLFKKRYNINDDMLTFLNNAILTANTDEIIEAIENSNGYGKTYINYLRSNNKLTPEKINLFRQSMMHVGNYISPIIGGTILNQLFNIKEEKK